MDLLALLTLVYIMLLKYPTVLETLAFLGIASYYDAKYREIDAKLFIAMVPPIIVSYFFLLTLTRLLFGSPSPDTLTLNTAITAVVTAATYVLARLGMKGYGDVFLVLITGLLNPYEIELWGLTFTPLVLTIIFGLVYVVAVVVSNTVHNIRRWTDFAKATSGVGPAMRAAYMVLGKVMTRDEFKTKKFYFPLYDGSTGRLVAKVGVEPLEGDKYDIQGEYVVAAYGMPFSLLLLVGYAVFVALLLFNMATGLALHHGCG